MPTLIARWVSFSLHNASTNSVSADLADNGFAEQITASSTVSFGKLARDRPPDLFSRCERSSWNTRTLSAKAPVQSVYCRRKAVLTSKMKPCRGKSPAIQGRDFTLCLLGSGLARDPINAGPGNASERSARWPGSGRAPDEIRQCRRPIVFRPDPSISRRAHTVSSPLHQANGYE